MKSNTPKITEDDFLDKIQVTEHKKFFDTLKKEWGESDDRESIFIRAYKYLNDYSLDGEPNRKVKYINTTNDAIHAFYGGFCDIVVTKEGSMRAKAMFLYEFFGIETTVIGVNEFSSFLENVELSRIKSVQEFYDLLIKDVSMENEIGRVMSQDHNFWYILCLPKLPYFNYFNRFQVDFDIKKEEPNRFLLTRKLPNWVSNYYFFDEIFQVVSNIVGVFNVDLDGKLALSDNECDDIRNNVWSGRLWLFSPVKVYLNYKNGDGLALVVDYE